MSVKINHYAKLPYFFFFLFKSVSSFMQRESLTAQHTQVNHKNEQGVSKCDSVIVCIRRALMSAWSAAPISCYETSECPFHYETLWKNPETITLVKETRNNSHKQSNHVPLV